MKLGLVHGDVSGRTVLVTDSGRIVLVDWGTAQREMLFIPKGEPVGTGLFADPHFWDHGIMKPQMDLYGFGVCAIGLLLGSHFNKLLAVQTWRGVIRSSGISVEELEDGVWGRVMDRLFDTEDRPAWRSIESTSLPIRAFLIGLARAGEESPRLRQIVNQRREFQAWSRSRGPEAQLAQKWFDV